ncbi:hypothetical protein ACHAWF_004496 [Thalassiosira exigua]
MNRILFVVAALLHLSRAFSPSRPLATPGLAARSVARGGRVDGPAALRAADEGRDASESLASSSSSATTTSSLEEKMKSWEASDEEVRAATLGGVVPGGGGGGGDDDAVKRTDAFDVGLYIAFPIMVISCLAFVFFPIIVGNIDVTSVGPPPTS